MERRVPVGGTGLTCPAGERGVDRVDVFIRVLLTVLISAGIAGGLSLFSEGNAWNGTAEGAAVFRQGTGAVVTEENLVDALVALPLHLKIRKADLAASILSVDITAVPGNATAADVYHDLYELALFGRSGSANIRQVLVRVLEPAPGSKDSVSGQLLVAMDARKDEISDPHRPGKMGVYKEDANERRDFLQSRTRLTFSNRWKNQFGL
jgi:hypothetical protein